MPNGARMGCRKRFVDNLRFGLCRDRLLRRREIVVLTRDYVDAERKLMDDKSREKMSAAQQGRKLFLDEVQGWYDREAKRLEAILARLDARWVAVTHLRS